MIVKRIAIFLCCIFRREDGSDCGGVSTRGHGQREGPDGDKWSKTTQETLGGSGVSEANGVLRNHYHPPGHIDFLVILLLYISVVFARHCVHQYAFQSILRQVRVHDG